MTEKTRSAFTSQQIAPYGLLISELCLRTPLHPLPRIHPGDGYPSINSLPLPSTFGQAEVSLVNITT